jgi:hypothetical protein
MYCRYKCDVCNEWHALAGIPTNQLFGAWLDFVARPPEPFPARVWGHNH